jgi:hypothetical protein
MNNPGFTTMLEVAKSSLDVFNAINNVRGWWSEEIKGVTDRAGGIFDYHYRDTHVCKIEIGDLVPGRSVIWKILENRFSFTKDKTEWTGTVIHFNLSESAKGTVLQFKHEGLVPEYECFEVCRDAWTNYIQKSLRDLIMTGKGQPNPGEGGFNEQLVEEYELKS